MLRHGRTPRRESWFSLTGPESDVVLSTRIGLLRNIASLPFLHRMTSADLLELRKRVERAVSDLADDYALLDSAAMPQEAVRFYRERGVLDSGSADAVAVISDGEDTILRIGPSEHLSIEHFRGGLDISGAAAGALELDRELESILEFAVTLQRGYLFADITRSGSGLFGSVIAHVPGLVQTGGIAEVAADLLGHGVDLSALSDGPLAAAHLFAVRSEAGGTESETLSELEGCVATLVHYERTARGELYGDHGDEIREGAFRAVGTIRYARSLGLEEALDLLTLIRMEVARGENLDGLSLATVDALLFLVQPAQVSVLSHGDGATIDTEEAKRAAVVRSTIERSLAQGE